jgi:aldehyde:ferredoxin oxidoreductase
MVCSRPTPGLDRPSAAATPGLCQEDDLVTGWDTTAHELHHTARRIVTAKMLFNIRAGWTPAEDCLPGRFFDQPLPDDPDARLVQDDFLAAVRAYNLCRGWTTDGWPEPSLLEDLFLATSDVTRSAPGVIVGI